MDKKKILQVTRISAIIIAFVFLLLASFVFLNRFIRDEGVTKIKPISAAEISHKVLYIGSYTPQYFTYAPQKEGLEKILYPRGIEFDTFFMDTKRYSTVRDKDDFREFIQSRLAGRDDYEVIIASDDEALQFVMDNQEEMFKNLPVVFLGINDYELAIRAAQNPLITGFYEDTHLEETLEIALKLFPEKKKIAALHDRSAAGISDLLGCEEFVKEHNNLSLIDLDTTQMGHKELVAKLEELEEDTLLFFMTCYTGSNGESYSIVSRTNTVLKHTNVPIFRNYVGADGMGVLGGVYLDFVEQSEEVALAVADIIEGINVSLIPLATQTPRKVMFDYNLVKNYGVDFSLLPSDTVFVNRPESFMERYGKIMPVAILIILSLVMILISVQISVGIMRVSNAELTDSRNKLAESEEFMRYQTEHDEMLDILNRRTAMEYLHNNTTDEQVYSIVIIDLDGFKELNESYGHAVADSVLQYLVALFKDLGRRNNWLLARFGGDEFLLMIPNEKLTENGETTEKILSTIRSPIPLGDESVSVTASMGISVSDGATPSEQNIVNAEIAMYEAKRRGKNCAFLYGEEMKENMKQENLVKTKLLEAFDNDGFYMLYQPKVHSKTKKVCGFEALVRMKAQGIYPGQFIPIAERNGWIWRIGRITTELVIKQIAEWRKEGYDVQPVSINYSSNQLNDHGYIGFVENLLEKYNVPASLIEIEITEGVFLEKSALADELFQKFKSKGIRLLMDDFGTGYSSLGYLTYIPVDVIKLDKSLVDTYLVDGKDSFIRNIINLMHDLNKEMVIEGVEEEWQFKRLQEFGADTIQGYYFSKPISAEDAIVFTVKDA